MASIDNIIKRSRRRGELSGRRRFTIERERAISKMRRFALQDPHHYVLELIQSAIANRATSISFFFEEREVLFAYHGGFVGRDELAHLFDFLFASKDRLETGHLRELALGINALLLFEPDVIAIESGDGTFGNTYRMNIIGTEVVEIGAARSSMNATWMRATGLNRRKVHRMGFADTDERLAIETRCLCTPVPIIVNGAVPFGASRARILRPVGFHPVEVFDEGDLYGYVGVSHFEGREPLFRVITHGVWIQSMPIGLVDGAQVGGIVSFDRLRKTADHSAIVLDDVFEEMKVRLKPYAQKALTGKPVPGLQDVAFLGGKRIPLKGLRGWLQRTGRIVAVPSTIPPDGDQAMSARRIGALVDAPVVTCPPGEVASLRRLGGPDVRVIEPELTGDEELRFYTQPLAEPPPQPWLAAPVELPPLPAEELGARLAARRSQAQPEDGDLFTGGTVKAMLYAPSGPASRRDGVRAQVLTTGRIAWQGEIAGACPGHWLVVRLPDVAPGWLCERLPDTGEPRAKLVADCVLEGGESRLTELSRRVQGTLHQRRDRLTPDERGVALRLLAWAAVVRLRARDGEVRCTIGTLAADRELLHLPLFRTLDGQALSATGLFALMERCSGFVYGVVPGVPADLDGLDRSRILALDAEEERLLLALLGPDIYVRIDARDVLARAVGYACRDVALGLRDFPDFPLLLEGDDPGALNVAHRERTLAELVRQLVGTHREGLPVENRLQARRHLQWLVCRELASGSIGRLEKLELVDLPLFPAPEGGMHTALQVQAALESERGLGLVLERDLAPLVPEEAGTEIPAAICAGPFLAGVIAPLGETRLDFDFDMSIPEAEENPDTPAVAFAEQTSISGERFSGLLGVPAAPVDHPAVVVLGPDNRRLASLPVVGRSYGVVGTIRQRDDRWDLPRKLEVLTEVEHSVDRLMIGLARRLSHLGNAGLDPDRLEGLLLDYSAQHLRLLANPQGVVGPSFLRPGVQTILELPLFDAGTGQKLTALRPILEFCQFGEGAIEGRDRNTGLQRILRNDPAAHRTEWLRRLLVPSRIIRQPSSGARPVPAIDQEGATPLEANITTWLARLRPDALANDADTIRSPTRINLVQPVPSPNEFLPWELDETAFANYDWSLDKESRYPRTVVTSWLYVNQRHWLVERHESYPDDPETLAWLLLACYASMNARLQPVTNEHEQEFQARIFEALLSGELRANCQAGESGIVRQKE